MTAWSPEQISNRLKADFPDDESMRISREAIYQALYIQGRGALKRELVLQQRTGRALRVPRARSTRQSWAHVTEEVIGLQRSAIGTLVERTTRFTILIHLPRGEGYGVIPRTKNGPALAGYGAVTMADALAKTNPHQLRQSVTWDRGKELSDHARFTVDTGEGLLRRPEEPVSAGHEGEHERFAAPILL